MKIHAACCALSTAVLAASAACASDGAPKEVETTASAHASAPAPVHAVPATLARVDFHVEGMTCGGCEVGTRAVLRRVDGVQEAGASYPDSRAWAVYDPSKASPAQMMAAIRQLGYKPAVLQSRAPTAPAS